MEKNTILVYLKPLADSEPITESSVCSLFSQFAKVVQVTNFNAMPIAKAHVHFQNAETAAEAQSFFNGCLSHIGLVRVYSSSVHKLTSDLESSNLSQNLPYFCEPVSQGLNKRRDLVKPMNIFCYSNTDKEVSKIIVKSLSSETAHSDKIGKNVYGKTKSPEKILRENYDDSSHEGSNHNDFGKNIKDQENIIPRNVSNFPVWESSQERLTFVQVENLNTKFVNHKVVINLLCCFGNAFRVYFNQKNGLAIAKYHNSRDAERAVFYLKNQNFFGFKLKTSNEIPEDIDTKTLTSSNAELLAFDCKPPDFRYKNSLKIKFNAPSTILHLTNLSENCTPQILFEIVSKIHEPITVVKLSKKSVNSTNMMLIEFKSIDDSLDVLAILHNKIIDHKSIRVSFSHTKIN